jgi:hypothetical protein
MDAKNTVIDQQLGQFKQHLTEQGYVSPLLGSLEPLRKLPESQCRQEVLGLVFRG